MPGYPTSRSYQPRARLSWRRSAPACIAAVALLGVGVPVTAHAFTPPDAEAPVDEVRLESGGFIRGEIVEYMPGSYIVIVPRGRTDSRRIEWNEISEVIRGGQSQGTTTPSLQPEVQPQPQVQPQPEVPKPEPEPEPEPEPDYDGALIHINQLADKSPMVLYHVDGEAVASAGGYTARAIAYSEVCVSPCDIVLDDVRGEFFLGAERRYSGSKRFRLSGDHSAYELQVRPRPRALLIGGWVLLSLTPALIGMMATIPYIVDMPRRPHASAMWAGAGLVGAFGIGGGIAMLIFGRTKVEVIPSGKRRK
jgi:hypothetical protein